MLVARAYRIDFGRNLFVLSEDTPFDCAADDSKSLVGSIGGGQSPTPK